MRTDRGLSKRKLAELVFVACSTVARWESGNRLPDAAMISRLSHCLDVDVNTLLSVAAESNETPNVIMVDDRKIILAGGLSVLEQTMPNATVIGFTRPSEALENARSNRVALAFLDVELGKMNGLELCRALLEISPRTNVVNLTAYSDYSLEAWNTWPSSRRSLMTYFSTTTTLRTSISVCRR